MDLPIHLLYQLSGLRFIVIGVFSVIAIIAIAGSPKRSRIVWLLIWAVLALNLFLGPALSGYLVYTFGKTGQGRIVGTFVMEHDGPVVISSGYHGLIRTADGRAVFSDFDDWDGLDYPPLPRFLMDYPPQGEDFSVRYLADFPGDFVILTNKDNAWALAAICQGPQRALESARSSHDFVKADKRLRDAYRAAIQKYIDRGCASQDSSQPWPQLLQSLSS